MNDIPDRTKVALFRERFQKTNIINESFEIFESYQRTKQLEFHSGEIIDSAILQEPKQGNSPKDNKELKANRLPDGRNEGSK